MYVYIYTHCYCQTQLRHTLNKTYGCNGSRKTDSAIGQCFVSVETHRPTVTSKSVCRTTEPGRNRSLSVSTSSVCVPDATEHGETMERLRFSARKASHGGEETGAASCQGKCQGAWSTSPRLATSLLDQPNTPPPLQLERCSRLLAHAARALEWWTARSSDDQSVRKGHWDGSRFLPGVMVVVKLRVSLSGYFVYENAGNGGLEPGWWYQHGTSCLSLPQLEHCS